MSYPYEIYDVFTEVALGGNPLAVVHGTDGFSDERMQAVAREFNLSETVFVLPAEEGHTARVRIFTPGGELPFAGHPTVGTAIAVARRDGIDALGQGIVTLEEGVGPLRCGVRFDEAGAFAEFDLPVASRPVGDGPPAVELARLLNIGGAEIGFENHMPGIWDGGVPYTLVPVRDPSIAGEVRLDAAAWLATAPRINDIIADLYVYTRGPETGKFHARMFGPSHGISEDPATGSAVAALAGALVHYDKPMDGTATVTIAQGIEMGRPSRIALEMEIEGGELTGGRIGGHAVRVASGELYL